MKFTKILLAAIAFLACNFSIHAASTPADTDGDGVNDSREQKDGTDPKNASSFNSLSKGLVAYYPFNGNANDESGNAFDASGDNLVFSKDRSAIPSSALALSASFATSATTYFDASAPRTFSQWVKVVEYPSTTSSGWGPKPNAKFAAFPGSVIIGNGFASDGEWWMDTGDGVAFFNFPISTSWKHVVVVYSGDVTQAKVYLNGEVIPLARMVFGKKHFDSKNYAPIAFGSESWGTSNYSNENLVDDIRIYNRALSETEVSQLYSKESGIKNLITNGSFETPEISGDWVNFTKAGGLVNGQILPIAGWTVDKGDVDIVRNEWIAHEGSQSLDLAGYKQLGAVSQSVSTISGTRYLLSFYYANNPRPSAVSAKVELFNSKGTLILQKEISHSNSISNNMNWKLVSVPFIANSDTTTVIFEALSLDNDGGICIDNVSIQSIALDSDMVTVQGGTLPSSSQLGGQKVETFEIGKYEVTWGEWKTVRDWALANGYTDLAGVGEGSGDDHPVRDVNRYDVVKWCNAKSENEGLEPFYRVSGAIYRIGQAEPTLQIGANGYRLPHDTEWEWAARGGVSSNGYTYSGSDDSNLVAWTRENSSGAAVNLSLGRGTWPVAQKGANELGIYDMSGNVKEWCEDAAYGNSRRTRGGNWDILAGNAAVAALAGSYPAARHPGIGFRLARNASLPADTTAPVITLLGANPQMIYKGATFTDPGATVTDNVDATRTITGNGSVDTTKVGNYTLTYAATDIAGNVAQPVTRTINVVLDQPEMVSVAEGSIKISKFEVSWSEWSAVKSWAESNGYGFDNTGSGDPVQTVSWFDVLKWCNAKSQMEGKTPVYETTLFGAGSSKVIYKSGKSGYYNVGIITINNSAEGYFIPSAQGWDNYVKNGAGLGVSKKNPVLFEWCWDRPGGGLSYDYRIIKNLNSSDKKEPQKNDNGNVKKIGFRYAVQSTPSPADTTAPVIAITSISANARLTSANATFGGTIVEAGSKPTLQYRLGTTGNWTASTVGGSASPYSFSQLVALKPGPNTVQFQAKDDAGNTSALASVNVSYVVASTLTITAPNAADGSVTSGFGGSTSREVGVSYTVTATPASGMVFKEWLKNGVSTSTNATLTFTMQPGLTLKPVFVPDFAKLGGFYNGLVGVGAIGNGTAADMQAFAANNGFIQITSGANGALSGVLKIEGKSHSFNGTMGSNKRATITVPRPGKGNATLSLSLISALPGEISGNVTTSGSPLAFRALRAAYTAGAAKHALAGKRYEIMLPPPSGLAMGYGHATLTVEDNGAAVLSGMLANGQAVNAGARIVDDGAGNWVFPVYVGGSGIFTGEIVIPKTTPASGSELGGSLEWLKPASNMGLFKSGFLKSLQPLGATHSTTSAGLGGAAFSLTLDPAKRILPAAVVQTGTWGNSGSPILTTPVKNGLTLSFNPLSGKFEGSFTRTVNGAPLPTPIQGTLFSRPISIPGGATLRGAGFFMSGNASTAIEITSNATVTPSPIMVTVQGGTLPPGSELAGQTVSTFQIGKYEVTWEEWKAVRDWAVNNNKGYDLAGVGAGNGDNFPVTDVSWYDVVKWCNARSEKEGLTPVFQNGNGTTYKTGEGAPTLNSSANGYRLPSEKEWEWAARGGVSSKGFTYSGSNTSSDVAWTYENSSNGTKAVGTKAANELGIYDMSGNMWEWCEDVVYTSLRRLRGGSWINFAEHGSVSYRGNGDYSSYYPDYRSINFGFRPACSSGN